ncbi:hypothetical protein J4232_05980 [Candidatus Woesearchaeota archaeon]|nr:hypothetical protein [Candidatus Woesearchaeota archaeon]
MAKTNTIVQLKQENDNERMWYVEYWANYVNSHTDKEWSSQQKVIINSQLQNAKHYRLTPKEYLSIKGEKCFRD